jgi:hypothetical protein
LSQNENATLLIKSLFGVKWTLIFGFSVYFFYSFYTFKPKKNVSKKVIEKEAKVITKDVDASLTPQTQEKLDRLLHKKKLQTQADKIIRS